MSKKNGIAKADDFRKLQTFSEPERVRLPKLGKDVMLRRPSPLWFLMRGQMPLTLSEKVKSGPEGGLGLSVAEVQESAKWMFEVIQVVMADPRCSMTPGPDEISPDMIDMEDAAYIVAWAYGTKIGSGEGKEAASLDRFPGGGQPESAGAHG